MGFHDVRFPTDISFGSGGGPEYATEVVVLASGHEQRNVRWDAARAKYDVSHGVKHQDQLDALIAFFRARKGRAYGFRFKDWQDYQAVGQVIGAGDGEVTEFQLVKRYVSGDVSEVRVVTKPVLGTVAVYLDSVLQVSGYSVNYLTGMVTFDVAPGSEVMVQADFEFDVPVRFDTDRLSAVLESYGVHSWNEIPLIEIRG